MKMRDADAPLVPPHDPALERETLGGAFHSVETTKVVGAADPSLFYFERHRGVHGAIAALLPTLNGAPPTVALVADALRAAGHAPDLALLAQMVEEGVNVVSPRRHLERLGALAAERERVAAAVMAQASLARGAAGEEKTWTLITARLDRARHLATAPDPVRETSVVEIPSAGLAEILSADPRSLVTTYIASPYVPHGIVALSARWGVGKTKLVQDLCLARAIGGRWLGIAVEPGPALFWSGEQGRREDFRTTQALCHGRGIASPADCPHYFDVIFDPPLRFGAPRMMEHVMRRVVEHPGLLVGVDSLRRAFEGDETDSALADEFFAAVLQPLRAAGATVVMLAHPPKASGAVKRIEDENYIRGSGDWAAQLDSFLVLRAVGRTRLDPEREDITLRLIQAKARGGGLGDTLLVTMRVTGDGTPLVAFRFEATAAPIPGASPAATEISGAVRDGALWFEACRRANRQAFVDAMMAKDLGRPAAEAALRTLVDKGVVRGPLDKAERLKGERGHVYVFVHPLPPPVPEAADLPDWVTEEPDLDY